MVVEPSAKPPCPMNKNDDIGDIYFSKWICHYMTLAVDSSPAPLPKHYKDTLRLSRKDKSYGLL